MIVVFPENIATYYPIFVFLSIAIILSLVITILPRILAPFKPSKNKLSAYECGFDPYGEARSKFDVRFYLVAILFIIFDLEIMFLFPWAISLSKIGIAGFGSMMCFLGILLIGYIYEWKKGVLEWND